MNCELFLFRPDSLEHWNNLAGTTLGFKRAPRVVLSEDTFRQALVQTFRGIQTKTRVTQVTQALKKELTSFASDAAFGWVLRRGATSASPSSGPPSAAPQQPVPRIVTHGLQDALLP